MAEQGDSVPHFLYLVRHGEHRDAEHGVDDGPLSERGLRQAKAIGRRLRGVPFSSAYHSPLSRASETAKAMGEELPDVAFEPHSLLMDCIPTGPESEPPAAYRSFFSGVSDAEAEAGRAQMTDAVNRWIRSKTSDSNELLVTHNFVIAWFVRHVLDAPDWKWMGLNTANGGLTIIRLRSGRPAQLVAFNDLGHIDPADRTGLSVPHVV